MDNSVESIEYYYDEDFSVPFDIGISEENNNGNISPEYNYFDEEDIDQEDYENDELDRVIMPEHIFSQMKVLQNCHQSQRPHRLLRMRNSYEVEVNRGESVVRMSCSSSPNSASSNAINNDGYHRLYFDSFTQNMSFIESNYSLKKRVSLFNQSNKNVLANYHLHFATQDSLMFSSTRSHNGKLLMRERIISGTDSGKCSAATTDSVAITDDPMTFFNNLGVSNKTLLRPDAILWRQIKYIMLYHLAGWSLLKLFEIFRTKSKPVSVTTEDIISFPLRKHATRSKRYSCSVLEVFHVFNDKERHFEAIVSVQSKERPINNFSCQFPPKTFKQGIATKSNRQVFDYPGIGKLSMPKQTRLNCSIFLSSNLDSQLSFLQTSFSNESDTSSNRIPNFGSRKSGNTESPKSMCSLNSQGECDEKNDGTFSLKPCLRRDEEDQHVVVLRPAASHRSVAATENFKRKSVSFDCRRPISLENLTQDMKEIPKKWGLFGMESRSSTDMIAVFECARRDSLVGYTGVRETSMPNDDAARFREMVTDVLRGVKHIFDRLSQTNGNVNDTNRTFQAQLHKLCEQISCGEGLDTPLATAIDSLITLLSDGLVATSFSSKKTRVALCLSKAAMRLWLLVEETCRVPSCTSRKSDLAPLLREVRQMVACSKDHQVRLRAFIAVALRSGLMHVWMRAVVANESALQRFYCPEAFLRQARLGQSDALAALAVGLKTLACSPSAASPASPPPVTIARRYLSSPNTAKTTPQPLYCEEATESDSFADESRSSQTDTAPCSNNNNNNGTFSRLAHPRGLKKSSSSLNTHPVYAHSTKKATKSPSSYSCNSTPARPSTASTPVKTFRVQPISAITKLTKTDHFS